MKLVDPLNCDIEKRYNRYSLDILSWKSNNKEEIIWSEIRNLLAGYDIDGLIGEQIWESKSIEQIEKECGIKREKEE